MKKLVIKGICGLIFCAMSLYSSQLFADLDPELAQLSSKNPANSVTGLYLSPNVTVGAAWAKLDDSKVGYDKADGIGTSLVVDFGYALQRGIWDNFKFGVEGSFYGYFLESRSEDVEIIVPIQVLGKFGWGTRFGVDSRVVGTFSLGVGPALLTELEIADAELDSSKVGFTWLVSYVVDIPMNDWFGLNFGARWQNSKFKVDLEDFKDSLGKGKFDLKMQDLSLVGGVVFKL